MNSNLDTHVDFAERAEELDESMLSPERARLLEDFGFAPPAGFVAAAAASRVPWPKPARETDPFRLAAGLSATGLVLIALLAIGALVAYQYLRESVNLAAKSRQIEEMATSLSGLQARVDAIEADRTTGDAARGASVELRGDDSSTSAFKAALAQIAARLDRVRDDAAEHFAGIGLRLDRLEANAASSPVAPSADPPIRAPTPASPVAARAATGSSEPPIHVLRGFTIRQIRDGVASIRGPDADSSVSIGDDIPGAGKVLRIDRRGRGWIVETSLGIIRAASRPPRGRRPPHP